MYGIEPLTSNNSGAVQDEEEVGLGIEASIEKELSNMKEQKKQRRTDWTFTTVNIGMECVFFLKTKAPVVSTELARQICIDARDTKDVMQRKCKYINRLVPVVDIDKSTPSGIERVARTVLGGVFKLRGQEGGKAAEEEELKVDDGISTDKPIYSVCRKSCHIYDLSELTTKRSMPSGTTFGTIKRSSPATLFSKLPVS
jgi:hypothetical protein